MNFRCGSLLSILCLLAGASGCRHASPMKPEVAPTVSLPAAETGFRPLFNGRDLSGFYTWLVDTGYEDPRRVFTVTNGWLRISGDGLGYLATTEVFRDYELTVEFKWGQTNTRWGDRLGKARDSGIFLHATGSDGNSHDGAGAFMAALECNVFEGATGDFLLIRGDDSAGRLIAPRVTITTDSRRDTEGWPWWSPTGQPLTLERWGRVNWRGKDPGWRDVTGFRGLRNVERPPGQWNELRILGREDVIEIRLNGELINRATKVWPRAGKILVQCEGSEIFIRKLAVRPAL